MKIKDLLNTFEKQIVLKRTPKGFDITNFGVESLKAAMEDKNNHEINATRCKNCGMINSILLIQEGCPNCGGIDFDDNISDDTV